MILHATLASINFFNVDRNTLEHESNRPHHLLHPIYLLAPLDKILVQLGRSGTIYFKSSAADRSYRWTKLFFKILYQQWFEHFHRRTTAKKTRNCTKSRPASNCKQTALTWLAFWSDWGLIPASVATKLSDVFAAKQLIWNGYRPLI